MLKSQLKHPTSKRGSDDRWNWKMDYEDLPINPRRLSDGLIHPDDVDMIELPQPEIQPLYGGFSNTLSLR